MALVIMKITSGKLMSRPVQATSPKYLERLFSCVSKSNIEM